MYRQAQAYTKKARSWALQSPVQICGSSVGWSDSLGTSDVMLRNKRSASLLIAGMYSTPDTLAATQVNEDSRSRSADVEWMRSRSQKRRQTLERLIAKMHCLQQPCAIRVHNVSGGSRTVSAQRVSVSDILPAALSKKTLSDCLSNRLTYEGNQV